MVNSHLWSGRANRFIDLLMEKNKNKGKFCIQEETEDVCFFCKDGGKLVVCDYENCGKAYHAKCIKKEDSFFDNVEHWECRRHYCVDCKKTPEFYCLGCPEATCRKCFANSYFTVLRGIKGVCYHCFELVEIIELNLDQDSEGNKVNMDDKETYEYFFKAYWEGVRVKEGFSSGGGVTSPEPNYSKSKSSPCIEDEEEKQNGSRSPDGNGDGTGKNTPTKGKRYNYRKSKSILLDRNCSEGEEETQNDSRSSDSDEDHTGQNNTTKRRYNFRKRKSFLLDRNCSEGEKETQNGLRSSDSDDHTGKNNPTKQRYNSRKSKIFLLNRNCSEGEEEKQNDMRSSDSNGDHTGKNMPATGKRNNAVEFAGWGSKPLVSFLKSIGKYETERMIPWDVKRIIFDYMKEKNLLHPKDSSKFLPDEILFPIFRKKIMAKRLVFSTVEKHIVALDDLARKTKDEPNENSFKDKHHSDQTACIKNRLPDPIGKPLLRKGDLYTKSSCFALVNTGNIKLVYLKRSLVLELSKQPESFKGKVVGTFVRAKVDSNDHKPMKSYHLVRVLGVVHDEVHNGILLQVSFMPKAISISELSDEDFTEKECEDLNQKVEASMIQKLTVEELHEKAQSLHEDITKHWIATRLVHLQNKIDRANLRGREREKIALLDEREKLKRPQKQEQLLKLVPSVSPQLIDEKYNDPDED